MGVVRVVLDGGWVIFFLGQFRLQGFFFFRSWDFKQQSFFLFFVFRGLFFGVVLEDIFDIVVEYFRRIERREQIRRLEKNLRIGLCEEEWFLRGRSENFKSSLFQSVQYILWEMGRWLLLSSQGLGFFRLVLLRVVLYVILKERRYFLFSY